MDLFTQYVLHKIQTCSAIIIPMTSPDGIGHGVQSILSKGGLLVCTVDWLQVGHSVFGVKFDADLVQGSCLDTGHVWHDLELSVERAATVRAEPVVVLLARVTRDGVRLWSSLCHLEVLSWNDGVGGESSATPLLTIGAVAKSLSSRSASKFVLDLITHARTFSRHCESC